MKNSLLYNNKQLTKDDRFQTNAKLSEINRPRKSLTETVQKVYERKKRILQITALFPLVINIGENQS